MTETWKTIAGFENYQISDKGRVKSLNYAKRGFERILEPELMHDGYLRARLTKNGSKTRIHVHRLVDLHFIPNPTNLPNVNHINGDRSDNRVENLEWISTSKNQIESYKKGHRVSVKGEGVGTSKLKENEVRGIKNKLKNDWSIAGLAREYQVSENTIRKIKLGVTWKHIK